MSEKNIIFDDQNINKSNFYESKILFNIDEIDVNKMLVLKKKLMVKKAHLNTLLDIMMVM